MVSTAAQPPFDPRFDLRLERQADVSPDLVWRAWTTPRYLQQWFTPAPWKTVECEIDLRPGGIFRTVMRSPEGQDFPNAGCYLDIVESRRLVWTNALAPGFRPSSPPATGAGHMEWLVFTAVISLSARGTGTLYTAQVLHSDEASCQRHAAMGFNDGWGKAFDQLLAAARKGFS
jgi:uncharacterized protein YndB with AHSA1/START domain